MPAGLVVLVLGGLIWATGRLAGVPGTVVSRSRRLLLIALAVAAVSVVALVVSLLGRQPACAYEPASAAGRPPPLTRLRL